MRIITAPRPEWEPALDVSLTWAGARAVVEVAGEIDVACAPFVSEVAGAALFEGALELWIDLTPVVFLDVVGAHTLLDLHDVTTRAGRRLVVITPAGQPRRLLEVTGAARRLRLCSGRMEAHRLIA